MASISNPDHKTEKVDVSGVSRGSMNSCSLHRFLIMICYEKLCVVITY